MNNDKDELIAEYGFRQEEIDNASQQITQVFGFSMAAIVALIGTSVGCVMLLI